MPKKMFNQDYIAKSNQYEVAITSLNLRLAFMLGLNLSGIPPLPTAPLSGI
jgi:hypothetical protein